MTDFIVNKAIKISSEFSKRTPEKNIPGINYSIIRIGDNYALTSGSLTGTTISDVSESTPDGFFIKGGLSTQLNDYEIVLRGDFDYGQNNAPTPANRFEGTIAIYQLTAPYPKPVPPSPPEPPLPPVSESNADSFTGNLSIDAPLFPYIYVKPWPAETMLSNSQHFISYPAEKAGTFSLYCLLVPQAQLANRKEMENLAIRFLQNEDSFAGQYFYNLQQVPAPFNTFPDVYNLLREASRVDELENSLLNFFKYDDYDTLTSLCHSPVNAAIIDQVWQNYFALTIANGYNETFFIALNKILLVWNIMQQFYVELPEQGLTFTTEWLHKLLKATIVLPGIPAKGAKATHPEVFTMPVFPLPPYTGSVRVDTKSWLVPYAIGQLKVAKYRLLRYQQGEVAQIQNILKGEQKKIVSRSLTNTREQTTLQDNNSTDSGNESKETTGELCIEAQKTVAALTKTVAYNNLSTSYGPPTQGILNGSYTKTITHADPSSSEDTNTFTSLVLNKTLNRINEAVLKSRSFSKYSEREETTSSIFNNTTGTENLRCIYRWVNKVYRIGVHNYGYRFLLELQLDSPASGFIASQQALNNINLAKPLSPADNQINCFDNVSAQNYAKLVNSFHLTKLLPPPEPVVISVTLVPGESEKSIIIPAGYAAGTAIITAQSAAGVTSTNATGIISSTAFTITNGSIAPVNPITLNNETGQVQLVIIGDNLPDGQTAQTKGIILNVVITCTVADTKMNEWKMTVFNEINQAYEKMMDRYDHDITSFASRHQQTNQLQITSIERTSIYKNCLDMMLNIYAQKVGHDDQLSPPSFSVNRQQYTQFLQKAIEWDEMTYRFDDYPDNPDQMPRCSDSSLRPFLQASSATVFLPVKPECNFHLLYYLSAGAIWGAEYPFVPINDVDLKIAAHLKQIKSWDKTDREEKHLDIIVPTDMQVVQEGNQLPDYSLFK